MTPHARKAERLRSIRVQEAYALLEKNPAFPAVRVEMYDKEKAFAVSRTEEEEKIQSEARLKHFLKIVDIRGEGYSRLVSKMEEQKALETMMEDLARWAWYQVSRIPLDILPDLPPGAKGTPHHTDARMLISRTQHWIIEGLRRIAALQTEDLAKPRRSGYRYEIKAWMKRTGIGSQSEAARRLGVSIDVLKSIMSDKGRARFSDETLKGVLKKIGVEIPAQ
jgi:hypothetical protein